ncbi:Uma2 family endonuclease [Streptomyces tubbatahanensis]|uniref:Uma2 family endonuclease n=2 Tax=Streptomyces tubbatahanensis TaxID=2923272 RepID=A0ABY3Y326_9ACTN|nr:Uma2 family endonuclease [Streptomyces tubbatahanensis]UNT01210.1 Uma2 family endonuclease [Streptomyces tubbatahanensis]
MSAAAPKGWRVELIEGEIHLVPPANGNHEEVVSEISGQVRDHRKDLGRYTGIGLTLTGDAPVGRVEPDLVLAPKGSFDDDVRWHDPAPVLLVGEVTSPSTAAKDRGPKARGFARAGIPCYLLIDREAEEVRVHTDPEGEKYTQIAIVPLGKTIALPDPLGFELDTAEF